MRLFFSIIIGTLLWLPLHAIAAGSGHTGHHAASPYAGQHNRHIKSLSERDIDDLRNGRGWGMAKAAELNGLPGPIHLLELREEIQLSAKQVSTIEQAYRAMKQQAIPLGEQLIELETRLEHAFASRQIDESALKSLMTQIATVRGDLRYVHLAAHLKTPSLLSTKQITAYNRLRGYTHQ
jgi:hypothetical protein